MYKFDLQRILDNHYDFSFFFTVDGKSYYRIATPASLNNKVIYIFLCLGPLHVWRTPIRFLHALLVTFPQLFDCL